MLCDNTLRNSKSVKNYQKKKLQKKKNNVDITFSKVKLIIHSYNHIQ